MNLMMVYARAFGSILLALAAVGWLKPAFAAPAPSFDLKRWETGEPVRLEDFAGQIVVLDFFAYWCVPCQKASAEMEQGIQKFYAARKGNAHGIPVRVVSINIEESTPKKTAAFIQKNGASFVINDRNGETLAKYGGKGIPFLVIIDGSRAKPDAPLFEIVYKNAGFEGTDKLRKIIDFIGSAPRKAALRGGSERMIERNDRVILLAALSSGANGEAAISDAGTARLFAIRDPGSKAKDSPSTETPKPAVESPAEKREASGPPRTHRVEADFESVFSSDILLTQGTLGYGQSRGSTEWNVSYAHNSFGLDYRPAAFDFLGLDRHVSEERNAFQANLRQRLFAPLTLLVSGGLYEGFTDYRNAWFNEYYRQQFSALPEYVEAEPNGRNISTGLRWEYLPTTGFFQAGVGFLKDEIAPGYEIDFDGLRRGRPNLYTTTYHVSTENILTRRVRLLNEFRITDTTGREKRYGYQSSVNVALGESWVVRTQGGYTREDPQLEAFYFGSTVEYEATSACLLSFSARYYKDTGEIENSLFSNAAPGVETYQFGVGVRYQWERSALKLYVAPYFTGYEPFGIGTAFFQNLYKDRDWGIAQIAYSLTF